MYLAYALFAKFSSSLKNFPMHGIQIFQCNKQLPWYVVETLHENCQVVDYWGVGFEVIKISTVLIYWSIIIHNTSTYTFLPLCDNTVPSGAQAGPGNVNQSINWHDVLDQSLLHMLTLLSPLATSHNSCPSILGNCCHGDRWNDDGTLILVTWGGLLAIERSVIGLPLCSPITCSTTPVWGLLMATWPCLHPDINTLPKQT